MMRFFGTQRLPKMFHELRPQVLAVALAGAIIALAACPAALAVGRTSAAVTAAVPRTNQSAETDRRTKMKLECTPLERQRTVQSWISIRSAIHPA